MNAPDERSRRTFQGELVRRTSKANLKNLKNLKTNFKSNFLARPF